MLIDEDNSNIFPLLCEVLKGALNLRGLGLGIDDEEVSLGVRRIGDVLDRRQASTPWFVYSGSWQWLYCSTYSNACKQEPGDGAAWVVG